VGFTVSRQGEPPTRSKAKGKRKRRVAVKHERNMGDAWTKVKTLLIYFLPRGIIQKKRAKPFQPAKGGQLQSICSTIKKQKDQPQSRKSLRLQNRHVERVVSRMGVVYRLYGALNCESKIFTPSLKIPGNGEPRKKAGQGPLINLDQKRRDVFVAQRK
jgi:hypothetical protein